MVVILCTEHDDDWDGPNLEYDPKERTASAWKQLSLADLQAITSTYAAKFNLFPTKDGPSEWKLMKLVARWMRVHIEVDGCHRESFMNRLQRLDNMQLYELTAWTIRNPRGVLEGKALTTPQKSRHEGDHEPLGAASKRLQDKETLKMILKEMKGTKITQGITPAWDDCNFTSAGMSQRALKSVWPNLTQDQSRQMIFGWLRIHMSVENLPFEAFYPRALELDPVLWNDEYAKLKKKCKGSSAKTDDKGAEGAKQHAT